MTNPVKEDALTCARLKELLHYDPETGVFTNRAFRAGKHTAGTVAGSSPTSGDYVRVRLVGHVYLAHRLAWLYVTGAWPEEDLDHVNGVRSDNRFSNLRECTMSENLQNHRTLSKANKSGFTGVRWNQKRGKWQAYITSGRVLQVLGWFTDIADAVSARRAAKAQVHTFNPVDPQDRGAAA